MSSEEETRLVDLLDEATSDEEPRRVNPNRFEAAEKALAWVFGSMASAIGFGAQNIAAGGGGAVWDAARIWELHMRMGSPARMKAAQDTRRLEWATAAMDRTDFEIAHLAFTPRGLSLQMRAAFKRKADSGRCLAAVAVKCPGAKELMDRRHEEARRRLASVSERRDRARELGWCDERMIALEKEYAGAERAAARVESVFQFLEWECSTIDPEKPPPRLRRIRDWADTTVDGVVERFIPILEERDAYDYRIRSARKEANERRNAELAAARQPRRPQTAEERLAVVDEIIERMVHGRAR